MVLTTKMALSDIYGCSRDFRTTSYRRVASLVVLCGSYCGAESISLSDITSGSFHHWDWLACISFYNVQRSTQIRNNFRNLVPLRAFPMLPRRRETQINDARRYRPAQLEVASR